jgi:hypothetical protein
MRRADMHSWKSASGRARGKAPSSTFANLRQREGEAQVRILAIMPEKQRVERPRSSFWAIGGQRGL